MRHALFFHRRVLLSWGLLLLEIVIFSIAAPTFLTRANVNALIYNSFEPAIVVLGMALVIIARGINLAIGEMMGILAIVTGKLLLAGWSLAVIVPIVLVLGLALGGFIGAVIAWSKMPDLIATIGFTYILRAVIFLLLGGQWLTGVPTLFPRLAQQTLLGIPGVVWWTLLLYSVSSLLLNKRPFGRWIFAVGSNPEAAELMGINPMKIKVFTHGVLGLCVAVAALLYINRLGGAGTTVGANLGLSVIAGALIGGTSIMGGSGSLWGALAGVLFMAVLRNGINLVGIPSLWEYSAIGLFILLSVAADSLFFRRRGEA